MYKINDIEIIQNIFIQIELKSCELRLSASLSFYKIVLSLIIITIIIIYNPIR